MEKFILWGHHHPDSKARKKMSQRRKLQGNNTDEHGFKNFQQNSNKQNPATH